MSENQINTDLHLVIKQRPTWHSNGTFFASLQTQDGHEVTQCPHIHSRHELAMRCGEKLKTKFLTEGEENG
jgi:hypothetical protein